MHRLAHVDRQLRQSGAAGAAAALPPAETSNSPTRVALSGAEVRQFVRDGYVLVRPARGELPPRFHDDFYSSCAGMFDVKRRQKEKDLEDTEEEEKAPATMGAMTGQINALLRAPTRADNSRGPGGPMGPFAPPW
jgi:hypothetical protein